MLRSNSRESFDSKVYSEEKIRNAIASIGIRIGGEVDTHFIVYCPFHYNVNSPACEFNKTSGYYICFSCGEVGHIIDAIMKLTNRNYIEAMRYLASIDDGDSNFSDKIDSIVDSSPSNSFDQSIIERLHNSVASGGRGRDYFISRGISESTMSTFKLGYSDKKDMIVIPVQDHANEYIGFVGRSVQGKEFQNSTGMKKSQYLFNLNRCKFTDIIVVESSIDCMRLYQLGYNAVATLGAFPSKRQIELLNRYARAIYVIPDSDEAGKKMVEKLLQGCKKDVKIGRLDGFKDVGEMTDEQISSFVDSLVNTFDLAV